MMAYRMGCAPLVRLGTFTVRRRSMTQRFSVFTNAATLPAAIVVITPKGEVLVSRRRFTEPLVMVARISEHLNKKGGQLKADHWFEALPPAADAATPAKPKRSRAKKAA